MACKDIVPRGLPEDWENWSPRQRRMFLADMERNAQGGLNGVGPGSTLIRSFPGLFGQVNHFVVDVKEVDEKTITGTFEVGEPAPATGRFDRRTGISEHGADYGWLAQEDSKD